MPRLSVMPPPAPAGSAPPDVVMGLTYYTPYVSGLTNAARDVAEGLVRRGRSVTVVTTRHDDALPVEEVLNGVRVLRAPVVARVGKGTIAPALPVWLAAASKGAGVVNLHLPLLEAGVLAAAARGAGAPVLLTYQCDVDLPPGIAGEVQKVVVDASSRVAMRLATTVCTTSIDYAEHSRLFASMRGKVEGIPAACHDRSGGSPRFRDGDGFHVGFLGRIVEEKGVPWLVEGFRALDDDDARLIIAGDFAKIAGGSVIERVRAAIGDDDRIRVLGFVPDDALPDLYASIDAFALPSVNAFEAFGIVQVEAMMLGVPALASDLPGVRVPVQRVGEGVIVPPKDAPAITRGLAQLRDQHVARSIDRPALAERAREVYGVELTVDSYERVFDAARDAARRR
ncbi:glycosyltransferase family 4 protein [Streptomyces sp. NP160]|uniref:glycosyltransferase family 4 protein n=1 Tax=Streptomyces sp. NP160 TaxID=2586637 RepID=UPI00214B8688|nr:glycosyltransferase family 4 protein [Streptomyces sp. NP160]